LAVSTSGWKISSPVGVTRSVTGRFGLFNT
jgi:hypothetical protein